MTTLLREQLNQAGQLIFDTGFRGLKGSKAVLAYRGASENATPEEKLEFALALVSRNEGGAGVVASNALDSATEELSGHITEIQLALHSRAAQSCLESYVKPTAIGAISFALREIRKRQIQ